MICQVGESGVVYRDIFIYLNTENGAQLLICAVLFQLNVEVILKVRFSFFFIVCMRKRVIFKLMYRCIFLHYVMPKTRKGGSCSVLRCVRVVDMLRYIFIKLTRVVVFSSSSVSCCCLSSR